MSGLLRNLGILVAVGMMASVARAEGVGSSPPGASTDQRLYGVVGLRPVHGGLISNGGQALRRMATGSRRWETLHTIPGDSVYRVAGDDSGRLLAAWEKDRFIHLFTPGQQRVSFPKPAGPPDLKERFQVDALFFLPNGRDALVFMSSSITATFRGSRSPSWCTLAYRIALDGKSEAELLLRVDHGYRLHTSRSGVVFAMNKLPGRNQCDHGGCIISAIVAYEFTEDGVRQKTLVDGTELRMGRARLVRGSDEGRVALMLDLWPKSLGLMRWRYGDEKADFRTVPWPANEDLTTFFLSRSGELIELRGQDKLMEVWRHSPEGDEQLASLRALQSIDRKVHGMGERSDGSLWLHWGDHIGLLSPGKPPRSYNLEPRLPRRAEWAGADIYVKTQDHLWVGIDTSGRYYERLDFAEVEKRSKPWPSGAPAATWDVVTNPKDPSTSKHLYDATILRPVAGGLISIGGQALRRLPAGSDRWETLHTIPGDNLYRVGADSSGRLLAAWELDPFIYLFSPDRKQRVAIPKPAALPGIIRGFQVTALEFSPDGRDALVFMTGDLSMGTRESTAVYRIALDGKSEARLIFRVDDAVRLLTSRSGAVFMLPEKPGQQECSHRTCWPISAIVAYELSGDGFRQRTLLSAAEADVSSADLVPGSGDERVALVLQLINRHGPKRNGGRALLRWRWGQDEIDYHPLPGSGVLSSVWLLTSRSDFIEIMHRGDGSTLFLDLQRYLPKGQVQTTSLRALQQEPSPYGVVERGDGGLWVHWGDRLALLSPGKPPRAFDIDPLRPRGFEWAGASVYVETQESLWIGLDGRGRNFVRVDLTDAERRSKEWR